MPLPPNTHLVRPNKCYKEVLIKSLFEIINSCVAQLCMIN